MYVSVYIQSRKRGERERESVVQEDLNFVLVSFDGNLISCLVVVDVIFIRYLFRGGNC